MTGQKPPEPNKTLLGLPNDLQAVLKGLEQRPVAADQPTRIDQAPAAAPEPTLVAEPARSPRSSPPPLPGSPGLRPPPLPAQRTVPPQAGPAVQSGPPQQRSLDRTLVGMPADLQAALQHAVAQARAGVPSSVAPAPAVSVSADAARPQPSQPMLAQPVRAIGAPAAPPPQAVSQAAVQREAAAAAMHAAHPAHAATPAHSVQSPPQPAPAQIHAPAPAQPEPQPWPPRPQEAALGMQPSKAYVETSGPQLKPEQLVASAQPAQPVAAPSPQQPLAAALPAVSPQSVEPPSAMQATRLATFETGVLKAAAHAAQDTAGLRTAESAPSDLAAPRLELPLEQKGANTEKRAKASAAPAKRSPAAALVVFAALAFGGVVAVRAPQLLPAPLAALLGAPAATTAAAPQSDAVQPLDAVEQPQPTAAVPGAQVATDLAAATDPAAVAAPTAAPSPAAAAPVASAAPATGAAAELEKQAIERLMANDYPAAKRLYTQLRAVTPTRAEYAVMIDLLERASAVPCGQPGQAPCAAP